MIAKEPVSRDRGAASFSAAPKPPSNPRTSTRWTIGLVVTAIALGGGWLAVWQSVRDGLLADDAYRLDPANLIVTPQPDWIHTDVRGDVIRDAGLSERPSILDDDLTARIAKAFALHPWVARVEQVSKRHPARVEVTIVYRRPACMVVVPGGLLAVDERGVLLPSDDFSPIEAARYPRLAGIGTSPRGPNGTDWGDAQVTSGAKVAAILLDDWERLDLRELRIDESADGSISQVYVMTTRGGRRITWGAAPGAEPPGESSATSKRQRLLELLSRHGGLDAVPLEGSLDLREGAKNPSAES